MTEFVRAKYFNARAQGSTSTKGFLGRLMYPVGVSVFCSLLLVACGEPLPAPQPVNPTPTVQVEPTPTIVLDVTAEPAATPTDSAPAAETEFQSNLTNYTVVIPQEWRVFDPRNSDIEEFFAPLDDAADSDVIIALQDFRESGGIDQVDFVARFEDLIWTVIVAPRNGLTLEDYLAATAAQLGDRVRRRGINTTLRNDGTPAATLRIAQSPTADRAGAITYQVIHYDERAENLIIHSFSASQSKIDTLKAELDALVKSVAWIQ